MKNVVIYL